MTDMTHTARRPLAALAAVASILAIAGCGRDDEPTPVSQAPVATTTTGVQPAPGATTTAPAAAGATTSGTSTATTTTPAGKPTATTSGSKNGTTSGAASTSRGRGVSDANGTPTTAPKTGTPTAPTPNSASDAPPDSDAPLQCLKQAGLDDTGVRSPGIWGGRAKNGQDVLVDGPYENRELAKVSADGLEGVTLAEAAGIFVVSAALVAEVEPEIAAVARCLRDKPA